MLTVVAAACPVLTAYPVRLKLAAAVAPLGWVAEVALPKEGAEREVPAPPGGVNAGFGCPDPAAVAPKFNEGC